MEQYIFSNLRFSQSTTITYNNFIMRRTIIAGIFILYSILSTFSQSNYKEGFIITNANDTIWGQIDFRTDYTNSLVCKFKQDEKATEKVYKPGEITGYRFLNEGKYYVSRTVEIDSLKRTVFLEFLVQGILNLYYLPEGNGYYFFENKDGVMISTTQKSDKITNDNKMKIDNRFKGVISYVFRDDIPLAIQTSKAEFNHKSMIEYTKEYHNQMCESGEKCIIFENDYKKKFTKFDFSAFSGVEFNDIKFNDINYFDINLFKMLSFSPIVGIGLNISSPRLIKSISLMLDATLSKIAGACDYSYSLSYFQYSFSGMKSNFSGGLEYIYQKGKIRPALSVGVSYRFLFNLNSTLRENYQIRENEIFAQDLSKGIKAGLGIDYQIKGNQFIIMRFLYSKQVNYYDMNNTYQLKIGYKF